MPNREILRVACVACLVSACIFASRSAAQDSLPKPVVIAPVEVITTRYPEEPHNVPGSVEVIGGDELRARGATTLKDALALSTGVAIAPGGDAGPAGAVPEFWGLREMDAFLLVVDGVPWGGAFNPAVASLSLQDVERIEVVRGPAPVTYGATSFVGVIHVVHKPAAAGTKYFSAHGGSFGTGGAATDFAIPSGRSWSSRASGDFERQGFKDDRTSFRRGHALLRSSRVDADNKLWFSGEGTILRQDPASPHPREGAALSNSVPLDANYNPRDAYVNENRVALAGGFERQLLAASTWSVTASFTHSEQNMFRGFLTDISNSANNASGFKENIEINDVYADSHLLWSRSPALRFATGADLLFGNGEAKGATFNYTVPLSGATATAVAEPTTLDKDAEDRRLFGGAYGLAEWRPILRLLVSGGLRLNMTSERRGEAKAVNNTRPSGSLGALYSVWEKGRDHARLFANFRNTFKPAAFDFSLAENEGILKPETSRSYEAGVKVLMVDGMVNLEASAFRMDFENLVTSTIVGGVPALLNAGKTRFKGIELGSEMRLPYDLSARATYSFHDGKFVDFVEEFGGTPTQLAGKRFEMSARHLASAGFVLSPALGLTGSASVNYTGDRYLNKRNTALAQAFTTVDAGIGYRARAAEVRLDGRNLTNRRDAVGESEMGDAQYYRMPARTLQAGVAFRY